MNKRVHQIAKERGLPAKEVVERLQAAGIDVKASSSTVDEAAAARVLGNGAPEPPAADARKPPGTARPAAAKPTGTSASKPAAAKPAAPARGESPAKPASGAKPPATGRATAAGGPSQPAGGSAPGGAARPGRPTLRRVKIDGDDRRSGPGARRSAGPPPPSEPRRLVDPLPAARRVPDPAPDPRRGANPLPDPRRAAAPDPRRAAADPRRGAGPAPDPRRSGAAASADPRRAAGTPTSDPRRAAAGAPSSDPRRAAAAPSADPRRAPAPSAEPRRSAPPSSGEPRRPMPTPDPRRLAVPTDPRRGADPLPDPRRTGRRADAARPAAAAQGQAAAPSGQSRGGEPAARAAAPTPPAQAPATGAPGEQGADGGRPPGAGGEAAHKRPTRDSLQGERAPGSAGSRRRVVIDSQASRRAPGGGPAPATQPPRRQRRGRRRRGVYDEEAESRPARTAIAEPDVIRINSGSTVKDVAEYLGVSTPEVMKKLMALGELKTLTQTLSDDTIEVLASEFEKEVEVVHADEEAPDEPVFDDAEEDLVERAPVVTIMGHVDHGKTSLLDAVRETEVAAGEAGGITQHIGAYQVHHGEKTVTFLDTPGHEAFTAMRARGARVTDIAVIVVAADDGVKPQTQEAVDHAKEAGVPMLVAVNKIDKEGAQPDRVRAEMAQLGLQPVEWGGDTEFVNVSAKTKEGLEDLLETILVMAEVEELRANPDAPASGTVIESKLDPGRGPVVTILVMRGNLEVGDALVAGAQWGRVRAMHDFTGTRVSEALPGEPVEVLGFDGVPEAGEHVRVVEHERRARQLANERATRLKAESLARRSGKKISLEDIFASGQKELNLVLKADVAGSLEAIEDEIAKLPQDEVSVNVIRRAVGAVTESDVMLASASDAVILAFNVRPVGDARSVAEREGVEIRHYAVIYRAIEELRDAMQGMLAPEEVEEALGSAEVRQIFRASRVGTIAGSYITDGRITRGSKVRLVRDGTVVYTGEIASLRRFNEDVREVATGYECGIVLRDFADVKEGDVLEAYATRQVERELV